MTASRRSTARSSAAKPVMSDLARIDAHTIGAHEYEEAPDLSGRNPSEGMLEFAGKPVRRGRPSKPDRKLSTTLRLDPDILDHFKSGGPGWQGRINAALRKSMQG